MTFTFSPSKLTADTVFQANCEDGYAFFRSSSNSWTASTKKVATCVYDQYGTSLVWEYDDQTSSLGDCYGKKYD